MPRPDSKELTPTQTIQFYFDSKGQKPFRFQREAWKTGYRTEVDGRAHAFIERIE